MNYLSTLTWLVAQTPERREELRKELDSILMECKCAFLRIDPEVDPLSAILVIVVWCGRELAQRRWP